MNRAIRPAAAVVALLLAAVVRPALGEEAERMTGRILGERCAAEGRLGECYLGWAHPIVFLDAAGQVWRIDLSAGGVRQERLDEAFGQDVELFGRAVRDADGPHVALARLNILAPPSRREFFKG